MSSRGGRDDERLRSPDFQRELMRSRLAGEYELVEYPAEIDVSGGAPRREVLDRILDDVEAGRLDGVAVAKLDRLSRLRPRDRVELVERIEGAGGVIRSASEDLDESTPAGRFAREVFFAAARMQLEELGQNFETSKRAAIAEGISVSSRRPFGLDFDARHRLEVVESEAEIVRELFEARLRELSLGELAELFARRTGREIPPQTVAGMLSNRVYLGELRYRLSEAEELVNLEPGFRAIVSDELFEAVQAVNRARSGLGRQGKPGGRPRALLAGIAKCANCGRNLVSSASTGGRARGYKCPNRAAFCKARAFIGEDVLDEYVLGRVLKWLGPAADELVEVEVEPEPELERVAAEERLAAAERALEGYETDVELELEVGEEAYRAGRQARVELVERRRQELEELGEASELETARTTLRRELVGEEGELDVDERRRLLKIVLGTVAVRKTPYHGAPASERAEVVFRA